MKINLAILRRQTVHNKKSKNYIDSMKFTYESSNNLFISLLVL